MSQTRTLAVTPTTFDLLSRNIRFLNLDLLIDWPGLNQDTFAFKDDIRAKSKARFKCAEWLLFRLFELWDPQVTKASLDIFFPPLEPLQSIKLRSTIFLLLEEMKRDGTMPRGCPLRKSLLDDCIGSKFEELLLSFSSVVLQEKAKTVSHTNPIAIRTAVAAEPHDHDLIQMAPLKIALRKDLAKSLRKRAKDERHYSGLSSEFAVRQEYFRLLADCNEPAQRQYGQGLQDSKIELQSLKRKLRANIQTGSEWLEVAVSGEPHSDRDALAEAEGFEYIWIRACAGLAPRTDHTERKPLMSSLEDVSRHQAERLARWRDLQSRVSQRNGDLIVTKSTTNSPRKTPLRPTASSPSKGTPRRLSQTYPRLSPAKQRVAPSWPSHQSEIDFGFANLPSRDIDATQASSRKLERILQNGTPAYNEQILDDTSSWDAADNEAQEESKTKRLVDDSADTIAGSTIGDMAESSKEPVALSLAQRTRKSMAFISSHSKTAQYRPLRSSEQTTDPAKSPEAAVPEVTGQGSLEERAQQSMSRLHRATNTKTSPSHRAARSGQLRRRPAFPVNPFEARESSAEGNKVEMDQPDGGTGQVLAVEWKDAGSEHGSSSNPRDSEMMSPFQSRNRLRRSPPGGSPVMHAVAGGE